MTKLMLYFFSKIDTFSTKKMLSYQIGLAKQFIRQNTFTWNDNP